jgi:hypothetical protein
MTRSPYFHSSECSDCGVHDDDAEGRAFRHRLDDVRRRQRVVAADLRTVHDAALRHRNACGGGNDLGLILVHGERRSEQA